MENLDPPPPFPKIKNGKMARSCPSRGFILDLGDGGLLFHFILSKVVVRIVLDKFSNNLLLHLLSHP